MLNEHKNLLELVQEAEAEARRIYDKGALGIENTYQTLRRASGFLQERVKSYELQGKTQKAEAAKAEAEKEAAAAKAQTEKAEAAKAEAARLEAEKLQAEK